MQKTRSIIVTGSSQGIGLAIAELFLNKGWEVYGIDKSNPSLKNDKFFPVSIDLGAENLPDLLDNFFAKKKFNALVNNAAIQIEKGLLDTNVADWNSVFAVNVRAAFILSKYFAPQLQEGSAIVNLTSVHARATSAGMIAYVSSKGALSALTRAMAIELGPLGIRVNSIAPGAIDTPMLEKGLQRNSNADLAKSRLKTASPINKIGNPKDVAQLCYFLTDNETAGNITGQEFVCDGGVTSRLASE